MSGAKRRPKTIHRRWLSVPGAALLAAAVALGPARAAEGEAPLKVSGYLKEIWLRSRSAIDGRTYDLCTARARLSADAAWKELRLQGSYDHRLDAGSHLRSPERRLYGSLEPKPWLDMEQSLSSGPSRSWGHGAYRAWLGWEGESAVLRAGRQRVAWGTGKLWNPVDVLNPFDPGSVEPQERRGADALYGRAALGELGQLELAWAPGDSWVDHALLARGRTSAGSLDLALQAGKVAGSTASVMGGGDFAATLFDGTLHGELAWFSPESRAPYWKAGLGYDYAVPSDSRWPWLRDAALTLEGYHAGNGASDPRRYDFTPVRLGREPGVARNYAGAAFSRDVHPLLKLELTALANADDGSTLLAPSATWNALAGVYLAAAWRRFGGERGDEFGRQPNAAVLSAQWWF